LIASHSEKWLGTLPTVDNPNSVITVLNTLLAPVVYWLVLVYTSWKKQLFVNVVNSFTSISKEYLPNGSKIKWKVGIHVVVIRCNLKFHGITSNLMKSKMLKCGNGYEIVTSNNMPLRFCSECLAL